MTHQTGTSGPVDPIGAAAERSTAIGIALVLSSALAWSLLRFRRVDPEQPYALAMDLDRVTIDHRRAASQVGGAGERPKAHERRG